MTALNLGSLSLSDKDVEFVIQKTFEFHFWTLPIRESLSCLKFNKGFS